MRAIVAAALLLVACRTSPLRPARPEHVAAAPADLGAEGDPCADYPAPTPPRGDRSAGEIAAQQVAELEAMQREMQPIEDAYSVALEKWSQDRAAGRDPGAKPRIDTFAREHQRRRHDRLHQRMHTGIESPTVDGRYGCIEALLHAGRLEAARRAAQAWTDREPLHGSAAIARSRVEAVAKDEAAAARWLRATYERLDISDPLHGTGAFFVDPSRPGPELEALLRAQDGYATERPQVLRGIAALARGDRAEAVRSFEAAIVANLAYQRQEGEAEMAAPVAYLSLLSMVVPSDSEQARTMAARHGVERLPAATRVLVLAASHLDPARLRVRVETNEHEAVFENLDVDGNEHGYGEGMILYPSSASASHGERVLVYARDEVSIDDPLVAALYVIERDGDKVRVEHHPMVFTRSKTTVQISV